MQDWAKLAVEMWSQIIEEKKLLYLALEYFDKNVAKKYQKKQIVNILWQMLRPKLAILSNF